jgi:capsid protein
VRQLILPMSEPRLFLPSRPTPARPARTRGRRASDWNGWQGASSFSRDRSWLPGQVTDARTELPLYTRLEQIRQSRFFKKNVGMVRGVEKDIVDLAVGPGIFWFPGTDSDAWNEAAFAWLWEWAKIADVSARTTFWESQRMRVKHKFWDGELYTLHASSAATGWPQYQLIRAHNCGNFGLEDTTAWHDGIRLNAQLRPVAYRFRQDAERFITVPASAIVHSYMLEDADQVHGVVAPHYAINHIHDILDLLKLEKAAVKELARTSRVITTESGEDDSNDGPNHFDNDDDTDATDPADRGLPLEQVFGPEIVRLRTGEKLEAFASQRPSSTFTGFIDYLGREITAGTGFPYEYSWNREKLNSAALRSILDKVRIAILDWRANEIEDSQPIIMRALAWAMESGELPFHPQWFRGEFIGGAADPTIDKGRDGREDRENVKAALDNFKLYWARQGKWWKTQLRQKAIEAAYIDQLAKDYGVSPDRIHQLAVNNSGAAPAARPADDDEAKPAT